MRKIGLYAFGVLCVLVLVLAKLGLFASTESQITSALNDDRTNGFLAPRILWPFRSHSVIFTTNVDELDKRLSSYTSIKGMLSAGLLLEETLKTGMSAKELENYIVIGDGIGEFDRPPGLIKLSLTAKATSMLDSAYGARWFLLPGTLVKVVEFTEPVARNEGIATDVKVTRNFSAMAPELQALMQKTHGPSDEAEVGTITMIKTNNGWRPSDTEAKVIERGMAESLKKTYSDILQISFDIF